MRDNQESAVLIGYAVLGIHIKQDSNRTAVRPVLVGVLQTLHDAEVFAQKDNHDPGIQLRTYSSGNAELSHAFIVAGDVGQALLEGVCLPGHRPEGLTEQYINLTYGCSRKTQSRAPCPVNALTRLDDTYKEIGIWRISPLPTL